MTPIVIDVDLIDKGNPQHFYKGSDLRRPKITSQDRITSNRLLYWVSTSESIELYLEDRLKGPYFMYDLSPNFTSHLRVESAKQ